MSIYYNEIDLHAINWLRELAKNNLIPDGMFDQKDIREVEADDVSDFVQCHFFAGIGGWLEALKLADWPIGIPVWTGSCPCQSFSTAGQRKGFDDDRHLWPEFRRLIAECVPPVVFGEQVSSPLGKNWLSIVRAEMEALGYEFGACDLCAAGVGAPHARQRLYFVAVHKKQLAAVAHSNSKGHEKQQGQWDQSQGFASSGMADELGGANRIITAGPIANHEGWNPCEWLLCTDGAWRPTGPNIQPLANGIPARMGRLRGYGNAIVPPLAAQFIKATLQWMENERIIK